MKYIFSIYMGSATKKEICQDGSKDENVFDIQQGVAIGLFIKNLNYEISPIKVHYSELWGQRDEKYKKLNESRVDSIKWTELHPDSLNSFFKPFEHSVDGYNKMYGLNAVYNEYIILVCKPRKMIFLLASIPPKLRGE